MKTYDLAQEWEMPCCAGEVAKEGEKRKSYPTFFVSGGEFPDLPIGEDVIATVVLRKVRSTEMEGEDGEETHDCTVEVRKLTVDLPDREKGLSMETLDKAIERRMALAAAANMEDDDEY
jgi:hypothetical protein